MKKQLIILVSLWSGIFTIWAFANPPISKLFADSVNNVGIATSTPMTDLDINGTTTIRKSLDMTNNKIINVINPTGSLDAANKAYVDAQVAAASTTITRVWGEGRPGTVVKNTAGECTRVIGGRTVKVSRTLRLATWDRSAAACPANWWVCSAADRGVGACGSGTLTFLSCQQANKHTPNFQDDLITYTTSTPPGTLTGWISNVGATVNNPTGATMGTADATVGETLLCAVLPVWCCSY